MTLTEGSFEQALIRQVASRLQQQLGDAAVSYCDRVLSGGARVSDGGLMLALRAALLDGTAACPARH